ncbi:transcriptional regulator [Sinorhizobium fredii USDA 205]|uniref:ArsR family transcriptional regulator n=2 Tax=Rhizobium fredii TaxID=380 RepID=A0A2A6LZ52_RHIFR|nr:metalloregulator ArsR/SmtB family transcription factor [Sinorhizobium fredii]ASY68308.1 Transcriptional regulator, ArsR family [Sinorhizobium fredii CCBAU 83666]AWM24374.1 Transcriptional regulator ArsR family [Sinorhizobium fredii CCBAU 25509]KSV90259.1 transcriptional regulator [Sinorhizobium fredii USDA 205]MCG5474026.1 winged helix-turn-helix domain-containing protein [Sinorhizobium fredii]MQW93509.1 metalloregulator ArsR/SmtB family transcription factor [Sinorhizobium fredii]
MISALDDTLLALADPTRRRIFEVLFAGETAIADVATAVGAEQDELSNHMVILEEAGLITRRHKDDREVVAADPGPLEVAAEWINTNRELWAMRSQIEETGPAPAPPQ